DEDTTTMGAEAARFALRALDAGVHPDALWFATAEPAYLEKTNATAIHAATRLDADCPALDFGGAARSGAGILRTALDGRGTIVTGAHARAARSLAGRLGVCNVADDLTSTVGHTGAAHPALVLSSVLERAEAGQVIALVSLADGADVLVLRATDAVSRHRPAR